MHMQSDAKVSSIERQINVLGGIAATLFLIGVIVAAWGLFQFSSAKKDLDGLGSFLSGGPGALWSVAGLVLIYIAFLGQRQQIVQQAEELALTREELRQTREEMQDQTATFEAQRFDSSFFSLLDSHESFTRALEDSQSLGGIAGRAIFRYMRQAMTDRFENLAQTKGEPSVSLGVVAYEEQYARFESILGPYFRSLYQVLKFVDDRRTPEGGRDERKRYANFVRARLSSFELCVLFYNLASRRGEKMRPLAKRYDLLKHLPPTLLLRATHLDQVSFVAGTETPAA